MISRRTLDLRGAAGRNDRFADAIGRFLARIQGKYNVD
jgi:hypothetical protein